MDKEKMEDSKEDMEKIQIIYVYISFLFFFYWFVTNYLVNITKTI